MNRSYLPSREIANAHRNSLGANGGFLTEAGDTSKVSDDHSPLSPGDETDMGSG